MRRTTNSFFAASVSVVFTLGGCAQAPKQLYLWETFPRQQYEVLLHEGVSATAQILAMEAHQEKARAANSDLPPGFRAHLGMLHLSNGNDGAARQLWLAEKQAFPESAPYMDSLLKRLDDKKPQSPASKENPA